MDAINRAAAFNIAQAKVDELGLAAGDAFEILRSETKEVEQGWIFFYNSAEYVRSRDPLRALAGNGPLLVLRDGQLAVLPTALPWQETLAQTPDATAGGRLGYSA
jgi:hypothetical protein